MFFAGLEGTGHHLIRSAFTRQCEREGWCKLDCALLGGFYPGLPTAETASDYLEGVKLVQEFFHTVRETDRQKSELVIPINCLGCRGMGMVSYPNFNGDNRIAQHVNLPLIAEIAEEMEVDFRVVYLRRNESDVMMSTVVKRGFAPYMEQLRVLTVNAEALAAMLDMIDPAFVECFSYERRLDEEQASRIASFISPSKQVADKFSQRLLSAANSERKDKQLNAAILRESNPRFNPDLSAHDHSPLDELSRVLSLIHSKVCRSAVYIEASNSS